MDHQQWLDDQHILVELSLATYEVDFFYSLAGASESAEIQITQLKVSGIPDYLSGEAAKAHIRARLLQDNPSFRRIRKLTVRDDDVTRVASTVAERAS
jgi:hypothetical protein